MLLLPKVLKSFHHHDLLIWLHSGKDAAFVQHSVKHCLVLGTGKQVKGLSICGHRVVVIPHRYKLLITRQDKMYFVGSK